MIQNIELSMYFQTRGFNGELPKSGGLEDQPAGSLERMTTAGNVYYAWKGLVKSGNKVTWQKNNQDDWDICVRVMELRANG